MPLDRGRFVVVHQCSTLSYCCQLATTLIAENQKNGKNWGFSPTEGDRKTDPDEIWHISVYRGSAIAHQIWPSSVKRGRYRSPQMSKFAQNCGFLTTGSRHNEHIQMKFGMSISSTTRQAHRLSSTSACDRDGGFSYARSSQAYRYGA